MSKVRADNFTNRVGTGAPLFPQGANVTGVITATTFSGNATTATTATTATNAQGLTGTPSIVVGSVTGTAGTFSGAVSGTTGTFSGAVSGTTGTFSGAVSGTTGTFSGNVSVGGTLTYEDVTNVDSVGVITARSGIKVLAGGVNVTSGGVNVVGGGLTVTGVGTFHSGFHTQEMLAEEVNVTAGKLSDNTNINVEDGMVHLFTTAESTTSTPNIRYNASTSLNDRMSIGQSIVVTLITTANSSAYSANITIDGGAVTENWIGGSAPSDGGSSGVDIHTFSIIKTASATFTVIGNQSKTS